MLKLTVVGQRGRDGVHVTSHAVVGRGHGHARVTTLHQRTAVTTVLVLTVARTSVCLIRVVFTPLFIIIKYLFYNQHSVLFMLEHKTKILMNKRGRIERSDDKRKYMYSIA